MGIAKKKPADEDFITHRITNIPSKYHHWFKELRYPELDIMEWDSGEWAIVQYLKAPMMPSFTPYQVVLGYMRNVLITKGFVEKYVKRLDMTKREFWAMQEAKTKQVEDEHAALEKHREDFVNIAHNSFMKNPAMLERIAKNGLQEMDLGNLAKHVPKSEYTKPAFKGSKVEIGKETANVSHPGKPVIENISEKVSERL